MKRTLFISHGGGPLPLLGDSNHQEMIETFHTIREQLDIPSAILLISAHWEESIATVTTESLPSLIYDYYGFPDDSYSIQYPAPGDPSLAREVISTLQKSGISVKGDKERGFDHGMFVPLSLLFPEADIPVVQLSLIKSMDPGEHMAIGKALSALQTENLLIIGSGFTFHNMQNFFDVSDSRANQKNKAFQDWLENVLYQNDVKEAQREKSLIEWEKAPAARYCHPREEHLLPLLICYGVEQRTASKYYRIKILGKESAMFLWE